MKAYLAYKDSSIGWLGKIPEHWGILRLKHVAIVNRQALTEQIDWDYELQYIDIGNVNQQGILNPPAKMRFADAPSRARRIVQQNDTIISTVRTYLQAVAFIESTEDNLIASTGFATLTATEKIYPKFLYYLVSSQGFVDTVTAESTGVSYPAITATDLAQISTWLPSLPDQQAIADFLDRKTKQIDTLIAKKQRQIELLQEQRTALINETMSNRQDRKNIFRENSPAPWLFSLPSGWKRQPLKYHSYMKGRIGYQNLRSEEYTEEGPLLVSSVHFKDGKIEWEKCNHVTRERFEMAPEIVLQEHDVLFMKDGALMGKLAFVDHVPGDACLNSHLLLMRPNNGSYLPRYLYYVLMTDFFEAYMIQKRNGTTFFGFSQESMGNFPISLPPIDEQKEICHFLDIQREKVKIAIGKINDAITGLQEYRTALISEAMTGKIDVRE